MSNFQAREKPQLHVHWLSFGHCQGLANCAPCTWKCLVCRPFILGGTQWRLDGFCLTKHVLRLPVIPSIGSDTYCGASTPLHSPRLTGKPVWGGCTWGSARREAHWSRCTSWWRRRCLTGRAATSLGCLASPGTAAWPPSPPALGRMSATTTTTMTSLYKPDKPAILLTPERANQRLMQYH